MALLLPTFLAYVMSAVLIRFVLLSPRIRGRLLSEPSDNRWHKIPTPSFGGVPMFAGVVIGLVAASPLADRVTWGLVVGATVLLVLGVLDDSLDMPPRNKLAGQLAAGALAVIIAAGDVDLSLLGLSAVMALVVLLANSVNLLDNMDGLAGGTTLVSLITMLPVVLRAEQAGLALVVTATAGAVAGFLVFNVSPARVFMGDSGSMWLGLVLAATVALTDFGVVALAPMAAATVVAVPLLDTLTVVYSRLRHGLSISRGGRDHLSHRLVRLGLSDGQAVLTLVLTAAVCGLVGVSRVFLPTRPWIVAMAALWTALALGFVRLARVPIYEGYPEPRLSPAHVEPGIAE